MDVFPAAGPGMTATLAQTRVLKSGVLAPGNARAYVREACVGVVPEPLLDDVLVVVSELVTNASTHGRGKISLVLVNEGGARVGKISAAGANALYRDIAASDPELELVVRVKDRVAL